MSLALGNFIILVYSHKRFLRQIGVSSVAQSQFGLLNTSFQQPT